MGNDEWIKKEDMVEGAYYLCDARNFSEAKWKEDAFHYMRAKFGDLFQDKEYHWDDGAPHGTCKPLRLLVENSDG